MLEKKWFELKNQKINTTYRFFVILYIRLIQQRRTACIQSKRFGHHFVKREGNP